ncbi:MAG TPA: DUF222 domain-containing protein [Streptosporangiaceae bacterium]
MAEAAYDYLNGADLPALPVAEQAECLKAWARVEARRAAAEAGLVAAFRASGGPEADGQKSMAAWLTRFGRCTKPAARGMVAAAFRVREHRQIEQALADAAISPSYGRWIGDAVDRFDAADREAVEEILVRAAVSGAMVDDLEKVAAAALRRLAPGGIERAEAAAHTDRNLTLSKTIGGVGRLNADLDAEATALTEAVIGALSVKAGPEDDRTAGQRRHDALAEGLRRLLASDLLPERGSAKPHLKIDMDLATLRNLPGAKRAEDAWVAQRSAELAARRLAGATTHDLLAAAPSGRQPGGGTGLEPCPRAELAGGSVWPAPARAVHGPRCGTAGDQPALPGLDAGASLTGAGPISGALAAALGCDSVLTPTVVGAVDRDALAEMTDTWLHARGLRTRDLHTRTRDLHTHGRAVPEGGCLAGDDGEDGECRPDTSADAYLRLQQTMLRWAIEALSGPGGLASYLRTQVLDGPLNAPSIVLDVGADTRTIPAPLERAIRRRDRRCRFPGCDHPAELSQVHHVIPVSEGGPTQLWNLLSLCPFHHLIAVHSWGWTLRLNPDGTTTATGPDGRTLHETDPPGDPPLRAA